MSLLKYSEYITESKIIDLLLESKVIYSRDFIKILNKIDNKISNELKKIYSTDVDGLIHNYLDITDKKDIVSFTPDKKAQEIKEDTTYTIINSQRYLTHSDRNDKIFSRLGYNKDVDQWIPDVGDVGVILGETISRSSGNIYVLFQEYGEESNKREAVINKEALRINESTKVWKTSRNNIKVGRLIRAILKSVDFKFVDKDIEEFTNLYKSTFDFMKDSLKMIDIVSGDEISYWYSESRYVEGGGPLNNSCMADVDSSFFDIYTKNKQCSLVILYDDEGKIGSDGKYTSDLIKGRALLWDCELDGTPIKFMDRIYTSQDYDVDLFKQIARENKWWYKLDQTMYPDSTLTNGISSKKGKLVVNIDRSEFDEYPYMDTICFISLTDGGDHYLTNDEESDYIKVLRDTGGDFYTYYDD